MRRYRTLQQVTVSPGGSRYVRSENYFYWPTPAGEKPGPARKSSLRAHRTPRANCELKFNAAAHAEAKVKRRKGAREPCPRHPCTARPSCVLVCS